MSRRLIVMRHARSPQSGATDDHERPIDATGRRQAGEVAAMLLGRGWIPRLVVSSDSVRARETWDRVEGAFDPPPVVEFTRALYTRGAEAALERLALIPPGLDTVLLIGHNPDWERLVVWCTGQSVGLGTANAALLTTDALDWAEAAAGPGEFQLAAVLRPRDTP